MASASERDRTLLVRSAAARVLLDSRQPAARSSVRSQPLPRRSVVGLIDAQAGLLRHGANAEGGALVGRASAGAAQDLRARRDVMLEQAAARVALFRGSGGGRR